MTPARPRDIAIGLDRPKGQRNALESFARFIEGETGEAAFPYQRWRAEGVVPREMPAMPFEPVFHAAAMRARRIHVSLDGMGKPKDIRAAIRRGRDLGPDESLRNVTNWEMYQVLTQYRLKARFWKGGKPFDITTLGDW